MIVAIRQLGPPRHRRGQLRRFIAVGPMPPPKSATHEFIAACTCAAVMVPNPAAAAIDGPAMVALQDRSACVRYQQRRQCSGCLWLMIRICATIAHHLQILWIVLYRWRLRMSALRPGLLDGGCLCHRNQAVRFPSVGGCGTRRFGDRVRCNGRRVQARGDGFIVGQIGAVLRNEFA